MKSVLLSEMSYDLGILPAPLWRIISTAPLRYKKFTVPKKSGGDRLLAQPAREVKALQYWVLKKLISVLPVHAAASAYREGASIKANAKAHSSSAYILKLDFENFFPSMKGKDLHAHLQKYGQGNFDDEDIDVFCRITLWAPHRSPPLELCIGAPSSPFLSNTLMFDFDSTVQKYLAGTGVVYTRYSDDLTFSSEEPDKLGNIEPKIRNILSELAYPVLRIKSKKTIHASRGMRRTVTGIVITPDGALSVGRDRKRMVRAMYDRHVRGKLDAKEIAKLYGLLSFIEDIEPGFSEKLANRYEDDSSWDN